MLPLRFRQPLKILVSLILVGYCLTLIDMQEVYAALVDASLPFLALAFLFTLLGTIVFKAIVTWKLLSQREKISFSRLLIINLSLRFYTMILPKAVVAGIRWNKYRQISNSELSLVLLTFEALFALTIAALATLVFIFLDGSPVIPVNVKLVTIALSLLFVALVGFLFVFPDSRLVQELDNFIDRFAKLRYFARLLEKWRYAATQLQLSRLKVLCPVIALGIVGHLLFLLGGYFLFFALSIEIPFSTVAWIRSAVFILVSIPISFAGIGIRELGFVALFGLYDLQPDGIMAYAVLALMVQTVIGLIGMTTELRGWFVVRSGVEH